MRTDNIRLLKDQVSTFIGGDRSYSVEGYINFKFVSAEFEPNLEALERAIREVDARFPWKDEMPPLSNEAFESIRYITTGRIRVNNWTVPEKDCSFCIHPGRSDVRRSQIYAYEKYLDKLSQELAQMKIRGVEVVRSSVVMHSMSLGYKS